MLQAHDSTSVISPGTYGLVTLRDLERNATQLLLTPKDVLLKVHNVSLKKAYHFR